MEFLKTVSLLQQNLNKPLPGIQSQYKLAPYRRVQEIAKLKSRQDAKKAAVLILLFPFEGRTAFPLMLRPLNSGVHSGQVSLPGGKIEPQDQSLEHTALRESEEELGIDQKNITLLGALTELYIPPSNFLVQPFVGYVSQEPVFKPQKSEVTELYATDLNLLKNPESLQQTTINLHNGLRVKTPCFMFHQQKVWGATAMILNEFKEILTDDLDK